jgi:hypothetical protein
MGRSLAPVNEADRLERFGPDSRTQFEALGLTFQVMRRNQRLLHKQIRKDGQGMEVAAFESEVHFALGSGRQGRSYLINREGFLTQSPISWYSGGRIWDLSPGYRKDFVGFGRQITVACLFCHSNQVRPVEHTTNHYEEPVFHGYAIGCERCHGPGQLHVESRSRGENPDATDFTIVNPRRLEPSLREAVCQQCHLLGEVRIACRGRNLFDFRPGLPLHLFVSAFVLGPESTSGHKSVGHVQQMYLSRCFRVSKGRLGCISCHDPHELPAPEKRVAFFRGRCLQCHRESSCSLPSERRRKKNPADSCIDCHMPYAPSENIAHAAVTDHRILRRPEEQPRLHRERRMSEIPLVHFHQDLVDPADPAVKRDLALAMIEVARNSKVDALSQRVGRTSLPMLAAAVRDAPGDVDAWEARGYAYWLADRPRDALAASETALALAPAREVALRDAAFFAAKLGRKDLAVKYWKRLLAVNPWQEPTHYNLAKVAAEREDWNGVLRECQAGLRIDPFSAESRTLLVLCYAKTGAPDRARAEFEDLLALKPPKEEELRRWFASLRVP